MPTEQAFTAQRFSVLSRCIQQDVNDSLNIAINGTKRSNIEPHASGDRGADYSDIESLTLDLAGFYNISGESFECCLRAELKGESLHAPQEPPL